MKIKTKLISVSLLLALIPLITATLFLGISSINTASSALESSAKNLLISIRDIKKTQIEDYFGTIQNQVLSFSDDRMIIDAMQEFSAAFQTISDENSSGKSIEEMKEALIQYYADDFSREYKNQNAGSSINVKKLVKQLDDESILLQYHYIAANPHPLGNKHKLDYATDGSKYSSLQKKYHSHIRGYLEKFEYYDIFLVDSTSGDIVYSVFKELDYTTSLIDGPYAKTGIGEAFQKANKLTKPDSFVLVDFQPYLPSYNAAASFIASPIFEGDKKVGVLIFQMPIGKINTIMTNNQKWKEIGLGNSGETYLLGSDLKARSMSRFLIEDLSGYASLMAETGTPSSIINEMKSKQSNIGLQVIDTQGSRQAIKGNVGFDIFPDYRNINVLSAYTPINVAGLKWALMAEIDEEEAFSGVTIMKSDISYASILMFSVISLFAISIGIFFAFSLAKPILKLSTLMRQVETDNDLTLRADIHSKDEIGEMAFAFNSMMDQFRSFNDQVGQSSEQLAAASEELTAITGQSSQSIHEQQLQIEQVATAMNEMSITVNEVSQNITNTAQAANEANTETSAGRKVVEDTVLAIHKLSEQFDGASEVINKLEQDSEEIYNVIDVIRGVAEQTNLLALNAAIEAARAGEQGRGFAVVADEVRTLAGRTQQSTEEINHVIEKLQAGSRSAVEVMNKSRSDAKAVVEQATNAGHSLSLISEAVQRISDMSTQIASVAEQQSATAEEIDRSIMNISDRTEEISSGAQQTAEASEEVARLGVKQQSLVSKFRI